MKEYVTICVVLASQSGSAMSRMLRVLESGQPWCGSVEGGTRALWKKERDGGKGEGWRGEECGVAVGGRLVESLGQTREGEWRGGRGGCRN